MRRASAPRSPATSSASAASPHSKDHNYQEQVGLLAVTRGGAPVTELAPAKRLYDAPRQTTTEAAIHVGWRGDLYVVLGDEQHAGGWVVRLYFNPLVRLIWIGAIVMALAGRPVPLRPSPAHRRAPPRPPHRCTGGRIIDVASASNAARFARPTNERTGMAQAPVAGAGPDGRRPRSALPPSARARRSAGRGR